MIRRQASPAVAIGRDFALLLVALTAVSLLALPLPLAPTRHAPHERSLDTAARDLDRELENGSGYTAHLPRPAGGGRIILVSKHENAPGQPVERVVREFPWHYAWAPTSLTVAVLLAGWWLRWRRTRSIARIAKLAEAIGPQTLKMRLPETGLPRDIAPLLRSVNGALARLDRAAAAQREFLRGAAHRLRTPLTVLSARAAALDDSEVAAQLRSDVGEIARIVTQLLQLNEIDALPDSETALADLSAVSESVGDGLSERAASCGVQLEVTEPDAPVLVRGDPNVIEVAVHNLVENALQHAPPGTVVTIVVAADGRITVGDAGPGVPEALRGKIFEPFWSGDPSGARPGIGLTIVGRVAERYHGDVAVAERPGGGALFTLRFPPARIALDDLDDATLAASLPASLVQRRRRNARETLRPTTG